jgi:hypothetical protein
MDRWWSGCFRDDAERKHIEGILRKRGEFGSKSWGLEEFDKWYSGGREAGQVGWAGSDSGAKESK